MIVEKRCGKEIEGWEPRSSFYGQRQRLNEVLPAIFRITNIAQPARGETVCGFLCFGRSIEDSPAKGREHMALWESTMFTSFTALPRALEYLSLHSKLSFQIQL